MHKISDPSRGAVSIENHSSEQTACLSIINCPRPSLLIDFNTNYRSLIGICCIADLPCRLVLVGQFGLTFSRAFARSCSLGLSLNGLRRPLITVWSPVQVQVDPPSADLPKQLDALDLNFSDASCEVRSTLQHHRSSPALIE